MPSYVVNWHHEAICDRLSQLRHEQGKKIMIFVGPQRGKSLIVSRMFTIWWLGHFPGSKNILSSYSGELASSFMIDAIALMGEENYRKVFPEMLTGHQDIGIKMTQNEFHSGDRGYWYSTGVGGTTTGKSAGNIGTNDENVQKGVFICDDPVKDLASVFSPRQREKNMEWWRAVANTRIHKTSHQILMHTRWHEEDIAGTLISEGAEERGWEIYSFPELGPDPDYPNPYDERTGNQEALWPDEKGDYDELMLVKKDVGAYTWAALYMQKPKVQGGNIIKDEWIQRYTRLPFDPLELKSSDIVTSWDLTFKKTQSGSFVVGVTIARWQSSFYLVDIFRKRADIIETMSAMQRMNESWPNVLTTLVEEKANGSAILTLMKKKITGLISVLPDASKDERLMVVAPIFEAGNFFVDANNLLTQEVIDELTTFPSCPYDDIVDAISQGLSRFGKLRGLARLQASVR